MNTQLVQ